MKRRTLWNLAIIAGVVGAWVISFDALWSKGTRAPFAVFNFWNVWRWAGANWWVNLWLAISTIVSTLLLVLISFAIFSTKRFGPMAGRRFGRQRGLQPVERGVTDNHGHAQWRSMEDTKALFPGPAKAHGGVVVGEAYRVDQDTVAKIRFCPQDRKTWGRGGSMPLLIDPCTEGSGHSFVIAGTGAFKTVSAVPSILEWVGSSVILDPSTELGPMLDAALRQQGKKVVHLGIPTDDETRPPVTGFNVLAWIDPRHPEAAAHVNTVISWICTKTEGYQTGSSDFFSSSGRQLVTCLLSHLVWSDPKTVEISLATLAAGMSIPEEDMLALLAGIHASSKSETARNIAANFMKPAAKETFSGIFLNATNSISWLRTRVYADLVSVGDFDPRDLLVGKTTVFLNTSLRTLTDTPAIARVLVGALLNTVYMAEGRTNKILFLLDEAARLGKLTALETARDTGRKYGVALHMLFQSIGQMTDAWGREGTRAWIDAASWIGYAAVRAGGVGKDLSDQLGSHGVLAWSEGDNRGRSKPFGFNFGSTSRGLNVNVHEIRRALISGSELQTDLRGDEIIIVPAEGLPVRCGRAIYFRRPKMVELVARSRFVSKAA